MKRKKILEFADWFSKNKRVYNQNDARTCLASHALAWDKKLKRYGTACDLEEIFDLTSSNAWELYWAGACWEASRGTAIKVLKRLARTGEVKWTGSAVAD